MRSSTSSSRRCEGFVPDRAAKINESLVICGEPARRTDNINTHRTNIRAWEGVWDQNHSMNGIVVRFDLRDSRIVGVSESRVGVSESRVGVLGVLHGIGIESEHGFLSITGAELKIVKEQEHLRYKSSMKIDSVVQEQLGFESSDNKVPEQLRSEKLIVPSELMHKPDHDQSSELCNSVEVAIDNQQSNSVGNSNALGGNGKSKSKS